MSMIASSSRAVLSTTGVSTSAARRTVVHHARPPRQPVLRAPQTPRTPLPTSGTSHPDPSASASASSPNAQVRSTQISGTNFTLHHAPPPSAPSYTTGSMPPFLQWVRGTEVSLTGEEQARLRKGRKREVEGGLGWDEGVLSKMREMRADGKTRSQIGDALSIPAQHRHLIARAAPATSEQRNTQEQQLGDQKSTWGYRKRLSREVRQKRRQFW